MPAPYRRLGRIAKAHGTTGEVSVVPIDSLAVLRPDEGDVWIVPPPRSGAIARRLLSVRPGPKGVLVRLTGIESPADAHEIVGRWLLVSGEETSPDAAADRLIGMQVIDADRGSIGCVADIIVTGANDVLVVEGGRFGQVLVPVIEQVVVSVDEATNTISVALLDGLIDEDD